MADEQIPAAPSRVPVARPPVRDGLAIGMVIGFAVWLPFVLFSAQYLETTVSALFGFAVIVLMVCAIVGVGVFIFRKQVATKLFGEVQLSGSAVSEALASAVGSWPDREKVGVAAATAAREGFAIASWMMARRAIVTALLGMVGTVVAMVGTVLLLKQTQALEEQNRKLDVQTSLLERQTKITAGEGQWESLWEAHYASNDAIRLDAVTDLAKKGNPVRGVLLRGSVHTSDSFLELAEHLKSQEGEFALEAAVARRAFASFDHSGRTMLGGDVAVHVERSIVEDMFVVYDRSSSSLSNMKLHNSVIFFYPKNDELMSCNDCSFYASDVNLAGVVHLTGVNLKYSRLTSWKGILSLNRCEFDMTVALLRLGSDEIKNCRGGTLIVGYQDGAPYGASETIKGGIIQELKILWDEERMREVELFLESIVDERARIGRYSMVRQEGRGGGAKFIELRKQTDRANAWNERRKSAASVNNTTHWAD